MLVCCERKTLLAGWFGLAETNIRTGCKSLRAVRARARVHYAKACRGEYKQIERERSSQWFARVCELVAKFFYLCPSCMVWATPFIAQGIASYSGCGKR